MNNRQKGGTSWAGARSDREQREHWEKRAAAPHLNPHECPTPTNPVSPQKEQTPRTCKWRRSFQVSFMLRGHTWHTHGQHGTCSSLGGKPGDRLFTGIKSALLSWRKPLSRAAPAKPTRDIFFVSVCEQSLSKQNRKALTFGGKTEVDWMFTKGKTNTLCSMHFSSELKVPFYSCSIPEPHPHIPQCYRISDYVHASNVH